MKQESTVNVLKAVKSGRLFAAALAFVVGSAGATMLPQDKNEDIAKRIAPIGQVRTGSADAAPGGDSGSTAARSGEAVYNQFCAACHTGGVLGAPKLNNEADWEPRLAQGMDTVLKHAIEGYNAMPPKGTCGDCSDDEIQAAIDYMIADI
ncbi:c-type cytochrome [Pseudidiomarina terrestris]|uniref:Cytochrome c5 family protein n=1 Tax=Pseudidiomarina terrestris TaxID=2820060 RepID=A0AAW7R2S5_9GAMM|nr:cytochrome c5 family protein [Pseudidiomarina sp. 1APP75-32.1]MDN7126132.1 cytochrome c5 family protein [Pseudidiomarina sp. 1APR75-33.1]MDN7130518.1 cytochrome c5 family protein [Pseudidiomarina sp. 1APR75-15]MDN7134160.1 cytochrome c5 family protein [Pseudidiomarina sp. 1ASP75-5]MDN7137153.1 cytochrome c5 family protein [Pseudidiomarina sp. 1ASP75-14]